MPTMSANAGRRASGRASRGSMPERRAVDEAARRQTIGVPLCSEDPPLSGALSAGLSSVARPSGHLGPDPWLCVPPSREVCSFRREVSASALEQGLCQTDAISVLSAKTAIYGSFR